MTSSTPVAAEFDEVTASSPWLRSMAKWRVPPDGVLPLWVADMDFRPPAVVRQALLETANAGLGYPDWPDQVTPVRERFTFRMLRDFFWGPQPEQVREFTNVTQAVLASLAAVTEPGDEVLIHAPAFGPLIDVLDELGVRASWIPMVKFADSWVPDAAVMHQAAASPRAKALLLVNPHNPTGRAFTRTELTEMMQVAHEHGLTVVSDEIHADLVHTAGKHIPIASLSSEAERSTITVTSASKAFNLAAARCAVAHFGPARLLRTIDHGTGLRHGLVNPFGVSATLAAWSPEGDAWRSRMLAYIEANLDLLQEHLQAWMPEVHMIRPEATYLAWLDFRDAGLGHDPASELLRNAQVMLSPGHEFGPTGNGFARINVATSRHLLHAALDQISSALTPSQRLAIAG